MANQFQIYIHPEFINYGCDDNGIIYSIKVGGVFKPLKRVQRGDSDYYFINLWHGGKKHFKTVHKFMMQCLHGMFGDDLEVDHINRIKTDNRMVNLRLVSASTNRGNVGPYKSNTTGFKGVIVKCGRYYAYIRNHGRSFYLGSYDTPGAAAKAYDRAAKRFGYPTNRDLGLFDRN